MVDLGLKFCLDETEHTEQTRVIVVNVGREIGTIVDTVSEVQDIIPEQIEAPPSMSGSVDTSFIPGMGMGGDGGKILLAIDKMLTAVEL